MNPLKYFWAYFETNHFTLYFAVFLLVLSLIKYLKFPLFQTKTSSHRKILFTIILLGLALRIGWLGFSSYEPKTQWSQTHMLESDVTNVQAVELTKGIWFHNEDGSPSAHRPIGYPMILGLVYKIFGPSALVAQSLNLLFFSLGAWLVFLIGSLIFSKRVGLFSAFFYSIYPVSFYSIKLMTDEHLFIPLWFFGLYLLLREIKGCPVRWPLMWYGVIFGYAAMTRTHAIFMPLVVAFAYILMRRSWKKVFFSFMTVMILMQVVNLPWVVRNYKIWGVPLLYTANNSYVYRSFNSSATPEGGGHIPAKGEEGYSEEMTAALVSGNGVLYHNLSGRELKRYVLSHPKRSFFLGICRAIYFMGWDRGGGMWSLWFQFQEGSYDPSRPVPQGLKDFFEETGYVFYYALFFCFLFSMGLIARRWKKESPEIRASILMLGSCFLFWLMEHMVIYPDRKYRFPLEPLMIVAGSVFLDWVVFQFKWCRPAWPGKAALKGRA